MVYFYVLCSRNILRKLVVYQQPTCLCTKMEFVVGTVLSLRGGFGGLIPPKQSSKTPKLKYETL